MNAYLAGGIAALAVALVVAGITAWVVVSRDDVDEGAFFAVVVLGPILFLPLLGMGLDALLRGL